MNSTTSLYDLSLPELEQRLATAGHPRYRALQVWEWLYQKQARTLDEMSNLPKAMRQSLSQEFALGRLHPVMDLHSKDGLTRKVLFELPDGAQVEAVKMTYLRALGRQKRNTLCISSQAGCAMGCTFCATGQGGFQRNLSSGEIVEQVLFFARALREQGDHVGNVVFMGMGEPFANYDQVMKAVRTMTDFKGIGLGNRRITISTVGLVPQILRFAEEGSQVNLAISLHAATDELRGKSMPVNRRFSIAQLLDACRTYTQKTHRRVSFEWAMINDVNDSPEQAAQLAQRLKGMLCHVNLIPLNPTPGFPGAPSDPQRIAAFCQVLDEHGIPNSIRARKGLDINAACGQLRQHHAQRTAAK